MIAVRFEAEEVNVGGVVQGVATWTAPKEANPRGVVISLGWRTEGRGTVAHDRVAELRHEGRPVLMGETIEVPFRFELPGDGPVSYDGRLIRVIWEVQVHVDLPWAPDKKDRFVLRVLPRCVDSER